MPFKDGRPEGFYEYPVSSAQKCGDALPRLQSPRMDRCWSLMTRAVQSGALPTLARATVPLHIRIGRNRNGEKRLRGAFFVMHICFWHKADIATVLNDVRFRGQSGHWL